jgi:hypothetical protein
LSAHTKTYTKHSPMPTLIDLGINLDLNHPHFHPPSPDSWLTSP